MEQMNEEQLWEMNYKPYPGTYQSNMDKKSIQRGDKKKSRPFDNSVPQASNLDNQEDEINHSFKKEVKRNYLDQSEGSSYMYPNRRYYKKRPRSSMKRKIDRASYEKIVDLQPVEELLTNGPIKAACNREKEMNNNHHPKSFYNEDSFIPFNDTGSKLIEINQPPKAQLNVEETFIAQSNGDGDVICFHCNNRDHLYCLNTKIKQELNVILYNNKELFLCDKLKEKLPYLDKDTVDVDSESGDYYIRFYSEQLSCIKNTAIEAQKPRRVDPMDKYDMEIID